MPRRTAQLLALALALGACGGGHDGAPARTSTAAPDGTPAGTASAAPAPAARARVRDWPTFGGNPQRTSATDAATGVTAANVGRLRRRRVRLPGTVDSAPIYLHRVDVAGAERNVLVMTTTYGRTLAVDAADGRILWTFTPPGYGSWAGSYRITQASPTADSDRAHVFAASPDGRVHRLDLATGRESPGWPVTVTRDPAHEKLTSSFNLVGGRLIVATGGYLGDAPPYQGHVVSLDPSSGRIRAVFNALCSNVRRIQDPRSCGSDFAAVWSRAGAVATGHGTLLVATGNGPYDGRRDWGDSVLELADRDLSLRHHWTPPDQAQLEASDADLGSVSPVVVPGGVLQSGKAGRIDILSSTLRPRGRIPNPGSTAMFSHPAVWRHGGAVTVFATTGTVTAAYAWRGGRLLRLWAAPRGGTSPLVAGGLLYVYDLGGALVVRSPRTGRVLATLPAGQGHWNSPVVADGVVALPEGDGNDHSEDGVLNLYRLP